MVFEGKEKKRKQNDPNGNPMIIYIHTHSKLLFYKHALGFYFLIFGGDINEL